jgi:hypothetical protein
METANLICFKCKHFFGNTDKLEIGCEAFEDGIPDEVLLTNEHSKPLPDQGNTIVFEQVEPKQKP